LIPQEDFPEKDSRFILETKAVLLSPKSSDEGSLFLFHDCLIFGRKNSFPTKSTFKFVKSWPLTSITILDPTSQDFIPLECIFLYVLCFLKYFPFF